MGNNTHLIPVLHSSIKGHLSEVNSTKAEATRATRRLASSASEKTTGRRCLPRAGTKGSFMNSRYLYLACVFGVCTMLNPTLGGGDSLSHVTTAPQKKTRKRYPVLYHDVEHALPRFRPRIHRINRWDSVALRTLC